MPDTPPDLLDPHWIPVSYEPGGDCYRLAFADPALLEEASFLDERMGPAWNRARRVSATELQGILPAAAPVWLFHTAFCCSTLLARALHDPPGFLALKEPGIFLDFAKLSLQQSDQARDLLARRLTETTRLLGRTWLEGGHTLVKPTNVANRLLPLLLNASPGSRALLLHGGLEDFLMSCAKKLPGADQPMRWMAQYLVPGTRLERTLGIPKGHEFNFIEACVLTWFAQMETYADALAQDTGDRLRTLDMRALLQQPAATVAACASWLQNQEQSSDETRDDRVRKVFSRDSKRVDTSYGPQHRAAERTMIMERYGELIRSGLTWASRSVAPHATLPSNWKPLEIP